MGRRSWRKILYEKQDYPDNYVDTGQFLNGMKKNLYTQTYTLHELVISSLVVSQELSSVCFFVMIYWCVQEQWLSPLSLFLSSLFLSAVGFLLTTAFLMDTQQHKMADLLTEYVKPATLFVFFLCGVSPILKTLTESISTDTIWAMTVGMLLAHLIFHNYGSEGALVSSSISLNAAIFASVCLASRLPSAFHVFVIVSFAVQVFALFPAFRMKYKVQHPSALPAMTLALVAVTAPIMATITLTGFVFYLLAIFSITFVCPAWLVRLQHLKNNIYGPWDEATVQM